MAAFKSRSAINPVSFVSIDHRIISETANSSSYCSYKLTSHILVWMWNSGYGYCKQVYILTSWLSVLPTSAKFYIITCMTPEVKIHVFYSQIYSYQMTFFFCYTFVCFVDLSYFVFQYLVFDTQMIVGGRKHEMSPEEHIFGALCLYLDVINIFLALLSIFGGRD